MNALYTSKIIYYSSIALLLGLLISFCSCENKMSDIDRLASVQEEEAVDISMNVRVTYSDSARVKAVLTAPEMRMYHDSSANIEFQKGVQIIFYNDDLQENQRINSEYALQRSLDEITEFRKNVVVNMADGSVIKSEEIIYDEKNQRYYNTVDIVFFFNDDRGNQAATSFTADHEFKRIEGENMTGYHVSGSNSPFPSFGF